MTNTVRAETHFFIHEPSSFLDGTPTSLLETNQQNQRLQEIRDSLVYNESGHLVEAPPFYSDVCDFLEHLVSEEKVAVSMTNFGRLEQILNPVMMENSQDTPDIRTWETLLKIESISLECDYIRELLRSIPLKAECINDGFKKETPALKLLFYFGVLKQLKDADLPEAEFDNIFALKLKNLLLNFKTSYGGLISTTTHSSDNSVSH